MMAAFLTCLCIYPAVLLRKDPLPAPLDRRVWVFAIQSIAAGQSVGRTSPTFLEEVVRSVGTIFSGALVPVIPLLQNRLKLRKEPANRCVAESEIRKAEAIKHVVVYLSMTL